MTLDLSAIKDRLNGLTQIPCRIFPIAIVGEGEQYKVINEYLQYALDAQIDVVALLDEVERLQAKLDVAVEALKQAIEIHYSEYHTHKIAEQALREIEKL